MTFEQAERYLLSLELFGMRFGLDRMRRLMTALGSPQERFRSIHIVGTNGKSSTARMTSAILERHGIRTGTYLSPHLVTFAERIRIGERDVEPERFAAAVARAAHAAEKVNRTLEDPDDRVTQFEALTAAAYSEMAEAGVAVAVVEAGLGGRYDATNVIPSEVQVLTNVGLEHTRWLGPTIADIASEKLAVVREGSTLVIGPDLHPDALALAEEAPAAQLVVARETGIVTAARGAFQRRNFALARAAAEALLGELDDDAVRAAAASTLVPGRFEVVAQDPETVIDGAHNPAGIAALAESLPEWLDGRDLVAVVSILDDKDAAAMLQALIPHASHIVCTTNANPRALSPATLTSLARQLGFTAVSTERNPRLALAAARERSGPAGAVLATGSIYLIADLLRPAGAAEPPCERRDPVSPQHDRDRGRDRRGRDLGLLRNRVPVRQALPVAAPPPPTEPLASAAMPAVFGINSDGLNTAVQLLILFLVVIWLALIYYTYADARRRIADPMLIGCATAASLFPFVGTIVYMIVRPPEYLEDVRERELEMQAAQARLHGEGYLLCPHCDQEVEKDFLRCPSCLRKLKDACGTCARPLDPDWKLCPYCEAEIPGKTPTPRRRRRRTEETAVAEPNP